MAKLNDPQAAQYALLVMYAEDMYDDLADHNKANPSPPIDPRVSASWEIVGFISAIDALADAQNIGLGTRFYYGFLARSKTDVSQYAAVIRGTANPSEWIEDMEFVPIKAPTTMAGMVENGFFSIYSSMKYTTIGDPNQQPVVSGIAAAVGKNKLIVLGHSLGSAIATYLTLDLAVTPAFQGNLSACLFASPHPADNAFAQFFASKVTNYKVFNYSRDIVPRVPFGLGYSALSQALEFESSDANAAIQSTLSGNHHAVCYAAMINYAAADWIAMPPVDKDCAACIKGPNP